MIKIDTRQIEHFERVLEGVREQALPFATRHSINQTAFIGRKLIQDEVRTKLTTRNKYTERAITVDRAKTLNIAKQSATVGTVAPYMPGLEFGETKTKTGSEGIPMATSYSSGEGENTKPRKRLPRGPNKMRNIQLRSNKGKAKSRKARNLVAIMTAKKSGRKHVYLDLGNTKGIFKVIGPTKKPRIKMVHAMTRSTAVVKPHPTFGPGGDKAFKHMPRNYERALVFQLRRWGYK